VFHCREPESAGSEIEEKTPLCVVASRISNDAPVDLNSLIESSSGWALGAGGAINDAGQIVGSGFFGGQPHAFLLTPAPEPSLLTLIASILAIYCCDARCAASEIGPIATCAVDGNPSPPGKKFSFPLCTRHGSRPTCRPGRSSPARRTPPVVCVRRSVGRRRVTVIAGVSPVTGVRCLPAAQKSKVRGRTTNLDR
jgi:hypothetical protein